eukprot:CAMPEP_0204825374 /NCGR_PEP_ID=MMETSP1346-20131115/3282_1 /ASSEMBLY_ACC=CAM_ASM_000771 /TAXON_ID=215587 /ORGANISM="Aplanochytrium stocchinoi, Strain GSBS06" /LENGTH=344 /DNA_ID=CAMNT_0051952993 /DNA_START=250 /DNA_END=1284 /DNA_ORIENTATION=+
MCWARFKRGLALFSIFSLITLPLINGKLKCFTNGDGPAANGLPCSLPFVHEGKTFERPPTFGDAKPFNFEVFKQYYEAEDDNDGQPLESLTWCSVVSGYGNVTGTEDLWGTSGKCFEDPEKVPVTVSPKYTFAGCRCFKEWQVGGHAPCTSYCCAPDGDSKKWCKVFPEDCQENGWGYCDMTEAASKELSKLQAQLETSLHNGPVSELFWFDLRNSEYSPTQSPTINPTNNPTSESTPPHAEPTPTLSTPETTPPTKSTNKPTAGPTDKPTGAPTIEKHFPEVGKPAPPKGKSSTTEDGGGSSAGIVIAFVLIFVICALLVVAIMIKRRLQDANPVRELSWVLK